MQTLRPLLAEETTGRSTLLAEIRWCPNPVWELLAFLLPLISSSLRPELFLKNGSGDSWVFHF